MTHLRDALDAVDVSERRATTRDGTTLDYDALLLALGALPGPTLPGALRFAGVRDISVVSSALERTADARMPDDRPRGHRRRRLDPSAV